MSAPSPNRLQAWLDDLPAIGIGVLFNIALLLAMHMIVLTTFKDRPLETITSTIVDEPDRELIFDATSVDSVGTEGELNTANLSLASAPQQADQTQQQIEDTVDDVLLPDINPQLEAMPQVATAILTSTVESRGTSEVMQGDGVEGAMDRLTFELSQSLKDNQTLAVWLFDASGSLKDERDAIAGRFDNVYSQLQSLGNTTGMYTQAATFGSGFEYLSEDPVEDANDLVDAIRNVPSDESGEERVFAAVGQVLKDYGRWRGGNWNRLLFIVTDERGDDPQLLDPVIAEARKRNFRVFVVGNAAVFGKEKAYVPYTYDDGFTEYIPTDGGPETAFPQLLDLAFWGGGDNRAERMSAGYGPWALTRLCAETGGMYLVAQQSEGPTFDPAIMRSYVPDYRPADAIEKDLSRNGAIKSLVQAATSSMEQRIRTPQTRFDAPDDATLRNQLTEAQKPLAVLDNDLERIHRTLEAGEKDAEAISDARWRASYDLALGRILALRVRAYGYNAMLAEMKAIRPFENADSNQWILTPSETVEGNPNLRKMAERARELLRRVASEHAGTPWAYQATRELAQPFGWAWTERRDERLAILSGEKGEEQARLLLAEEEDARESRMKQRTRPKL